MRRGLLRCSLLVLAMSLMMACAKKETQPATAGGGATTGAQPGATSAGKAASAMVVPAGAYIMVRLGQAVGSKISTSGQTFAATVAQPVEVNGKAVIPSGAEASGIVAEAVPLGRFKGGARLRLALETITVGGNTYRVQTAAITQAAKGKG